MFSFQVKVSPDSISGKIEASPVRFKERLVLAPFTKPPRIEFKNIIIGSVEKRYIMLENPADLPTEVELYQLPPAERNATFNYTFFKINPYEEQCLEIMWSPLKEGNWRDVVHLRASGSLKSEIILLFSSIMPPGKVTKQSSRNTSLQSSMSHPVPSLKKKQVRWGVNKLSPKSSAVKRHVNKGILTNANTQSAKNMSNRNLKSTKSVPVSKIKSSTVTKIQSSECSRVSTFGSKKDTNNLIGKRDAFVNVNARNFPSCDVLPSPDRRQTYDIPVKNKENFLPPREYLNNVLENTEAEFSNFLSSPVDITFSNISNYSSKASYIQGASTPSFLDPNNCLPYNQSPVFALSRVTKDILSDFQLSPCVLSNNTLQAVVRPFNINHVNLAKSLDKITFDDTHTVTSSPPPKTADENNMKDCFAEIVTSQLVENVEEDSLEKSAVIPENNDSVVSDFVGFIPDERSTPIGNRPLTPIIKDCSITAINTLSFIDTKESPLSNPKSCVHFPIAEENEADLNDNSHISETSINDVPTAQSNSDTFILSSPKEDLQRDSIPVIHPPQETLYTYSTESTELTEFVSAPANPLSGHTDVPDQSRSTELTTIQVSSEQCCQDGKNSTEFKSSCPSQPVCSQPDIICNNGLTDVMSDLVLQHSSDQSFIVDHNGSANFKPVELSSNNNPNIFDYNATTNLESKSVVLPEKEEFHLVNQYTPLSMKSESTSCAAVVNEGIALYEEKELLIKFNSLLTSSINVSDKKIYHANVADLWNEVDTENSEVTIEQIYSIFQLKKFRENMLKLFKSNECVNIVKKVETIINSSEFLTLNEGQSFYENSELKFYVMDLLLNYEPLWLRIGLETIFNCEICVVSKHDIKNVVRFLKAEVLLESPQALEKPYFSSLEGVALEAAVNKFVSKAFLLLVSFLDIAKRSRIMPYNPCLFLKNAKYKASYEIFSAFTTKFLLNKDRNLYGLEQILQYTQNYLDEFDYSLKCLTDFSDGIRLVRVAEILLDRCTLSPALYAPAVSYTEKLHNVNIALAAFKNHRCPLPLGVMDRDIVTANKEKIITLLSHLICYYKI